MAIYCWDDKYKIGQRVYVRGIAAPHRVVNFHVNKYTGDESAMVKDADGGRMSVPLADLFLVPTDEAEGV